MGHQHCPRGTLIIIFVPKFSTVEFPVIVNLVNQHMKISHILAIQIFYQLCSFSVQQSRFIRLVCFYMTMLLVLTIALFVGLASSRPSSNAIGKEQKNLNSTLV